MRGRLRGDSDPGYSFRVGKLGAAHAAAEPYKELPIPTALQREEERLSSPKPGEQLRCRTAVLQRGPVERVALVLCI